MDCLNKEKTAENIRLLRKKYHKTEKEIVDGIGSTVKNYRAAEKGKDIITQNYIDRLAEYYNVKSEDIAVYDHTYLDGYRRGLTAAVDYFNLKYGLDFATGEIDKAIIDAEKSMPYIYIRNMPLLRKCLTLLGYYPTVVTIEELKDKLKGLTDNKGFDDMEPDDLPLFFQRLFSGEYAMIVKHEKKTVAIFSQDDCERFESIIQICIEGITNKMIREFTYNTRLKLQEIVKDELDLGERTKELITETLRRECQFLEEIDLGLESL